MEEATLKAFTNNKQKLAYFRIGGLIRALPEQFTKDVELLQNVFYLKKAGTLMGKLAGDDLVPDHELALSSLLSQEHKRLETDEQTAIEYLRKEELHVTTEWKGWGLVSFKEKPLGWIKVLPTRINNYYPKEWRILKKGT